MKKRAKGRGVAVRTHVVFGEPEAVAACWATSPVRHRVHTSFVEHDNLTQRQGNRRLTRRTNGFAKDLTWFEKQWWVSLAYFGYPEAHEDDAQRAVRTGLGIVEAMATLNSRLRQRQGVCLAVRVGIHTGLVVVGEMGGGGRQERLALGDTPNIAARIQGLATPDTVVISAATQQLVQGYFTSHALGAQTLRGVTTPLQVHQVMRATEVQQRFDVAAVRGLTPLVGREHEVGVLRERWAQVQAGRGHIVVLSGEAGIGKSCLVQVLKDEIIGAATLRIEYRCSPYHQH